MRRRPAAAAGHLRSVDSISTENGRGSLRAVGVIGNHLPRQCGIATFTSDLAEGIARSFPETDCFVVAMNDPGRRYAYPSRVRFEIAESDLASYRRAADFLNVNAIEVVCVQHEYGIFGGKAGSHLFALLRDLRMPIVSTMHTVLTEPNSFQREATEELAALSERVVVMSRDGARRLSETYAVPDRKIDLIPHGIPSVPFDGGDKNLLGVEGKSLILTFGLLSPDKGIEHAIEALPEIVSRHPDTVYIVLGATHPHVKHRQGETYRLALQARAEHLGVASNVIFHDRFVSQCELSAFLAAADVYVTPYLNPEQITSGTLAYAVGSGKAVVSTPYAYARELLADGRGVLVPPRDPPAIARAIIGLLDDDQGRLALRLRAAAQGNEMLWPAVARSYHRTLERARVEHAARMRTSFEARTLAARPLELPELNLDHLRLLTDETGVLQHAAYDVPRYEDGYCLDDNARALLATALIDDAGAEDVRSVRALSSRYLAFVRHAYSPSSGRFRNFMSYARCWTEEMGSEDSHGRAVWALGTLVGRGADPGRQSLASELFHLALPAVSRFTSPRAWASSLLGIDEYLHAFQGDTSVQLVRTRLAEQLRDLFRTASRPDWPWFEDRVSYDNPRLSQALLVSGSRMGDEEMKLAGLRSLAWLVSIQRSEVGDFAPIGSDGFYRRGARKAAFDQQPIEACAMVAACLAAERTSGDAGWTKHAGSAFRWFLGQNHLQAALYDAATGGCRDGLHADRVNENQGAESTLSFLIALLEMRSARRRGSAESSLQTVGG
jgi:glycosyltransferase involved in cell wall biosynthesis